MRFHLTMFFMVIAVSFGMHTMASAAPFDPADARLSAPAASAPHPAACSPASHGGH